MCPGSIVERMERRYASETVRKRHASGEKRVVGTGGEHVCGVREEPSFASRSSTHTYAHPHHLGALELQACLPRSSPFSLLQLSPSQLRRTRQTCHRLSAQRSLSRMVSHCHMLALAAHIVAVLPSFSPDGLLDVVYPDNTTNSTIMVTPGQQLQVDG